jgi:hypothetical protein
MAALALFAAGYAYKMEILLQQINTCLPAGLASAKLRRF